MPPDVLQTPEGAGAALAGTVMSASLARKSSVEYTDQRRFDQWPEVCELILEDQRTDLGFRASAPFRAAGQRRHTGRHRPYRGAHAPHESSE